MASLLVFLFGLLLFFVFTPGSHEKSLSEHLRNKKWRKGILPMALIFLFFMLAASLVRSQPGVTLIAGLTILGIAVFLLFSQPKQA